MKEGDIIFVTRRHDNDFRGFISKGIAVLTKHKGQDIEDVKVHSAIIYKSKGVLMVRDMDKHGDEHYTLKKYTELFHDRMEIVNMNHNASQEKIVWFNNNCMNNKVKYDYVNTFVFQLVKSLTKKFIGKQSVYHRMCAEDVQRQYNILDDVFKTPEYTNPNELYKIVKK